MNRPSKRWIRLASTFLVLGLLVGCQSAIPAGSATAETTGEPRRVAPTEILMPTPTEPPRPTPTAVQEPGSRRSADADVIFVRAVLAADGNWTFHVTVAHPDTGWEDYADGWDVVLPSGEVVKPDADSPFTRLLLHPHQDEQPFTRSQSRIVIPDDVTEVEVRAHDLKDGFGGRTVTVDFLTASGPDFVVER